MKVNLNTSFDYRLSRNRCKLFNLWLKNRSSSPMLGNTYVHSLGSIFSLNPMKIAQNVCLEWVTEDVENMSH